MPRRGGQSGLLERTRKQRKTRGHKKEARNAKKENRLVKKTVVLALVVLALGLLSGMGIAATDPNGCVLHKGNHCKRLAAQTTTTSDTTTSATTTDETTTDTTTTTSTTPSTTGEVNLTDQEWKCPGAVNLTKVSVSISPTSTATDAVKLANGCTGYIGEIDVTQWKGDGIHLTNSHDLVIGKVVIRCYAHVPLKHQDGIQVLGGQRVTINNADVGCYSANNSQVWINDGAGGAGPGGVPTDVVFVGGHFQGYLAPGTYGPGGSYGVSIGTSVRTGFRDAVICPNAHPSRQLHIGSATDPVNDNNKLPTSC